MLRLAVILTLIPAALVAQAPAATPKAPTTAQTPKAPATAAKPAATAPAAGKPATRRPASTAAKPAAAATAPMPPAPMTNDEKVVYALGLLVQRSINQFDLSAPELDVLKRALTDAARGKPAIDIDEWGPKIEPFATARGERMVVREKAASAAYLANAATEMGAVKTSSGLVYREISSGTGTSPKSGDTVRVQYRGTLVNGTEFDSSYKRNEPAEFALGRVIPCWTEGVQLMKVGGKSRLVCPSNLAYGDDGNPSIPGGSTLIFEIELLGVVGAP
ncbi:MAG: FKBP-type peptidyl-prolyl cis-trans isomerase [Acidobacteriota bacterium]